MKSLVFAAALALAAPLVQAQEAGWYGGIDIGRSRLDADNLTDRHDTAIGLGAGYRLNRNFAIEGDYADLGDFTHSAGGAEDTASAKALSLSAIGLLPVWDRLSVYGKAGVARTEVKVSSPTDASDSGNGLLLGAGLSYDVNREIFARAGWDRYAHVGSDATGKGDIDLYSVGIGYRF